MDHLISVFTRKVMSWSTRFPHHWHFVREIYRPLMDSLHKVPVIRKLVFLRCHPIQIVEQTLEWPVICDPKTLIWRHCIGPIYFHWPTSNSISPGISWRGGAGNVHVNWFYLESISLAYRVSMRTKHHIVHSRYIVVIFLRITHGQHPIPRPYGRAMGCRPWVLIWPRLYHCHCCALCTIHNRGISRIYSNYWVSVIRIMQIHSSTDGSHSLNGKT